MNWISRHRVFVGITAFFVLMLGMETWFMLDRWRASRSAGVRLAQVEAALQSLRRAAPPATIETTKNLEAQLVALSGQLEMVQSRLLSGAALGSVPEAAAAPAESSDAYFDIASFVERMRDQARQQSVETKLEERFGFPEYSNAGPPVAEISAVLRQRIALEFLLVSLFATKPRQLISVQRERRDRLDQSRPGRREGSAPLGKTDTFEWDLRASVRRAATIDASAFRISFISQTASLRLLLNALSDSPLVVREVEVSPAPTMVHARTAGMEADGTAALVPESFSRITVTVELIEKVDAPAGS